MTCVSYVSSYYHCVFSTKERRPLIPSALSRRLWPFLGGIARQNERKMSFQEEFLALLKRHRIVYEERYLWE
jgi:hypothetical protein